MAVQNTIDRSVYSNWVCISQRIEPDCLLKSKLRILLHWPFKQLRKTWSTKPTNKLGKAQSCEGLFFCIPNHSWAILFYRLIILYKLESCSHITCSSIDRANQIVTSQSLSGIVKPTPPIYRVYSFKFNKNVQIRGGVTKETDHK